METEFYLFKCTAFVHLGSCKPLLIKVSLDTVSENNIPDSAFVEIFKDSNKTAYIFNLLTVRKYTVNQNEDIREDVKNKRLGR